MLKNPFDIELKIYIMNLYMDSPTVLNVDMVYIFIFRGHLTQETESP